MDICYAANENYAPYLAASMVSCIRSNPDAGTLRFHVISNGIAPGTKEKIRRSAESGGQASVAFYDLDDLAARLPGVDTGSYDISMLGRFFIGALLPESVERVLYLDCDTIVCGSLSRLFEKEEVPLLAAVPEPTIYPSILRQLGISREDGRYVNSGVLLINLSLWRKERAGERLLSFYRTNADGLYCGDQDAINYVLKGEIGALHPRYNYFTNYRYFRYNTLIGLSPAYARAVPDAAHFRRVKRHPVVIHYMGAERPWLRGNRNPYRRLFEQALAETAFAGRKPAQGQEAALLAYHLMNVLTFVLPPVRLFLSRAFERKKVIPRLKPLENADQTADSFMPYSSCQSEETQPEETRK